MAKQQQQQTKIKSSGKKLNLIITTPRGVKFVERADIVIMRCIDGDLGVLPGHAPLTTVLGDGILRYSNNGIEKKLALFGGTVEIGNNTVKIFSTIAQRPEEIDLARAERDRQEAEASLQRESDENKVRSIQVLLHRSLVRIAVSSQLSQPDYYINDDDESEKSSK